METSARKPSLRKRIAYFWGRRGIELGLKLAEVLPLSYLYPVAVLVGRIGFHLMGKYRKIVYHNLEMAFGTSKTQSQCREIVKIVFRDMVANALEVAKFYRADLSLIKEVVGIEGLEHLDAALGRGRGVVAVSAHLGNFALIGLRLVAQGYPFALMLRDPKDEKVAKTLRDLREKVGMESIPVHPRKSCVARSLECLKRNGILFLQIDQNASSRDLWVDFFGWQVPTHRGPVVFSMRTGAPLIPLFMIRDDAGRHRLIIKPPYVLVETDNREKDILHNTAKLTEMIECCIREHPSQWWWFHRRWKKARRGN